MHFWEDMVVSPDDNGYPLPANLTGTRIKWEGMVKKNTHGYA